MMEKSLVKMYKAIYKCRLCGKIFASDTILSKKDYEEIITSDKFPEEKYFMHDCDKDSIGCADFLGYRKVKWISSIESIRKYKEKNNG